MPKTKNKLNFKKYTQKMPINPPAPPPPPPQGGLDIKTNW